MKFPRMGCRLCRREAKVERITDNEIRVTCCGREETLYRNGSRRPSKYDDCLNGMFSAGDDPNLTWEDHLDIFAAKF